MPVVRFLSTWQLQSRVGFSEEFSVFHTPSTLSSLTWKLNSSLKFFVLQLCMFKIRTPAPLASPHLPHLSKLRPSLASTGYRGDAQTHFWDEPIGTSYLTSMLCVPFWIPTLFFVHL